MTPTLQGPPNISKKRRAPSLRRCCALLGILVVAVVGGFIAVATYSALSSYIKAAVNPHEASHHDVKINPAVDNAVHPLFDKDTVFDVAASIWLSHSAEDMAHGEPEGIRVTHELNETAIFSQIVMRGVTLSTKNVMTTVHYELPLAHFRQTNLSRYDVRSAITLIPHAGSKLDRVLEYSDWRPNAASPLPRLSNPFPLHSDKTHADSSPLSVRDQVIEHYGVSFSMIEFREIESRCNISQNEADVGDEDDEDFATLKEEDETLLPPKTPTGEPLHRVHPHLVTRTQAYIVNENRPYNRTKFDKEHSILKKHSCGQNLASEPSWKRCVRDYSSNGHREQRLILEPLPGFKRKEVAYGPYVSALTRGAGPRDVVPLPVDRENCTEWKNGAVPDLPDTMDVSWTIHFSSLSPAKVHLMDNYIVLNRFPFNATALQQAHLQNQWEQAMALFGQKLTLKHRPKRRLFYATISVIGELAAYLLDVAYWYTRTTATGISIFGAALAICAAVLDCIAQTTKTFIDSKDGTVLLLIFLSAVGSIWVLLPYYFMGQAVSPLTLQWSSWRSVSVQRSVRNHRERASRRLEDRVAVTTKLAIFLVLFACIWGAAILNFYVFAPTLPGQTAEELGSHFATFRFVHSVSVALNGTAGVLQLDLNRRSRTYAGGYRLAAYVQAISALFDIVFLSQKIVGTFNASEGLSLVSAVMLLLQAADFYQAWTLPRVEQTVEEE